MEREKCQGVDETGQLPNPSVQQELKKSGCFLKLSPKISLFSNWNQNLLPLKIGVSVVAT